MAASTGAWFAVELHLENSDCAACKEIAGQSPKRLTFPKLPLFKPPVAAGDALN
jgi:hypothetical protein